MSTVLGFEVYPLRDELQKIGSIGSFGISASTTTQRRPSGSAVSTTSYGSSTAVLSALEDSGNVNNRGILHNSSSHQRYGIVVAPISATASDCTRTDSSSLVHHNGLQRATSAGSLQRQASSETASRNDSYDVDAGSDRIIEEKRKTSVGDGYSIHRYTLGRLLGKGGFAKVFLCTAMDTGKNYAAKVVPKANLVKARARQKLQAEIKIHRNLKHRFVCQYKHYFEDRTNCYILLELCHNQSLNEMIKRRKRLTEPEAAYFIKQLVEATRYMHDQNVIHRDLKLGNLFLDKDMQIKVGDLGLATKVEDKDEKRKTICGTPNYIAPEIIQGDKALRGHSFEVDIWSMGVILFTVLVGKPPYEAKDVKATYQRILNNEYSFPRHIDMSPAAKSLIKSLLQSKPSDRPTLDEIDLHPFLVDNHIPMFLPTSTLTFSPNWRINEYGELVCSEKASSESNFSSSNKLMLPRASSSGRQPFTSRDSNMHKASTKMTLRTEKESINMERVVRTAVAAMTGGGKAGTSLLKLNRDSGSKAGVSPPFAIFDESARRVSPSPEHSTQRMYPLEAAIISTNPVTRQLSQHPETQPALLTEEALSRQTRLLSLVSDSKPTENSAPSSLFTLVTESAFSNTDNDVDVLQYMVDHLATVISIAESRKGRYRMKSLQALTSNHGPLKWVARYVDYTSKYGLGFLLNDGCSGVYFNDSTKIALEAVGDTFQYIERKRVTAEDGTPNRLRGETMVDTYQLNKHPEALQKKVTLLKHFRNHLVHQDERDDEAVPLSSKNGDGLASDLAYVKKWVRAKHAILFSLSNRTVQVIFDDQTEILMTPDVAFLTYVDTHRKRCAYNFTDELVGSSAEIQKRLKYAKEMMLQLLSGQRS